MESYILGCDWGTSSLRLGLYSLSEDLLIDEIQSTDGISGIYRNWQNGHSNGKRIAKDDVFRERLLQQIAVLSGKTGMKLDNTPVLISGMASSSIGIQDVPYAGLPFRLDGSGVKSQWFAAQEHFPHDIILISGVTSRNDVMRGEETQLIGIWSMLAAAGTQPEEAVFIFPGTHSKHVYVKDHNLVNFKSFMTGEMYQVIGSHSILKDSAAIYEGQQEVDPAAFTLGVRQSCNTGILNGLFTVRTNQLFKRFDKTRNANYLSGLLIGSELNDLLRQQHSPLFLCSGQQLFQLYKLALTELQLAASTTFIAPTQVASAAMTGQRIIYEQYANNKLLNG